MPEGSLNHLVGFAGDVHDARSLRQNVLGKPRRVVCVATPCWAGLDLIGALDLLTTTNILLGTMGRDLKWPRHGTIS